MIYFSDGEDQDRPTEGQNDESPNPQESDLFSFLSSMHLSGGSGANLSLLPSQNNPNLNNGAIISAAAAQVSNLIRLHQRFMTNLQNTPRFMQVERGNF
jgi:hypothetical protein